MARYNIIRKQLTPPGEDRIVETVESEYMPLIRIAELAQAEADNRKDVSHISKSNRGLTLIGRPAGTGSMYSPASNMVEFTAELDLDDPIPAEEAAEAIRDMIGFGAKNGSYLDAANIVYKHGAITLELMRTRFYKAGKSQRFKITVEPIDD